LPDAERGLFEDRFGTDFSQVRVHTDEPAAALAQGLGAKAFAHGHDVFFAHNRYQPGTTEGRRLLAHELTHVAQQDKGPAMHGASTAAEPPARSVADQVAQGGYPSQDAIGGAEQGVYCDDDEKKKPDDVPLPSVAAKGSTLGVPSPMPPPGSAGSLRFPLTSSVSPMLGKPTALLQPPSLMPSTLLQPPTALPPLATQALPPVLPPFKLMANADLLAPFSAYGTTPGAAGLDIRGDWANAYFMFRSYMPESLAATSANIFLASAYQSSFAFNQPSIFDKADLDFKAAYPEDKRTPIIPALSSSTLTKAYEVITKKKDTNKFYF
jgi:hypothetical protein